MKETIQIFAITAVLLLFAQPVPAEVLGTYGATYKIAEKDAVADIKEHAKKVNWKEVFSKKKMDRKVKEYRPSRLPNIPVATENRTFLRDMTYTLPTDIPDGKGGIAYPKGYTFNPLEYLTLNKIIVFINGSDKKQVRWFEKSPYLKDIKTMLIITDGSYYELIKRFKRPVYHAVRHICERFGIEHVPSVAVQKGKYMEISEIVPVVVEKAAKEKK
jgi:conjugal transfer pilus assembly protein TraW